MKNLFILLLLALGVFYCYDDSSNRRDLESAKKQIQQLTQERDQAIQKLGQSSSAARQPASTGQTNWFQKRLQEKSALDLSNSRGQPPGHH